MRYAQQSPMFIMLSQNSGGLVAVSNLNLLRLFHRCSKATREDYIFQIFNVKNFRRE
jgi:hypothetical protein